MARDFSGKVVIVTGSSSGIGEGTAILFAKLGAHVVVNGRTRDNVKRVANECQTVSPKGLKALEVIADLTNDEEAKNLIESTVKELGKIDVLVNNAGGGALTSITDEDLMDNYEKTMRLDLRAVVYLTHLAVPHLEKSKGNIVNISSIAAKKPMLNFLTHCMAKSALDMFTKCLAVELGPKGIRVNSINPGVILTKSISAIDENESAILTWAKSSSPLGIVGKPEDIANGVTFLASREASFITGINMLVDAGLIFG